MIDLRKGYVAQHLHRDHAGKARQVKRNWLRKARQVRHADHVLSFILAQVGQYLAVLRLQELLRAATEDLEELPKRDHITRPVQQ